MSGAKEHPADPIPDFATQRDHQHQRRYNQDAGVLATGANDMNEWDNKFHDGG
jgi:hypothetical protein